ncbi:hypothetical protein ACG873_06985 [Mesorhizobium sp. AaZ16]|uniref:hypothetical protein n=1 Tax=Mesorhizobium sp. AaZ16 TaxID=3402289 RepID=UPI00374F3167
MRVLFFVMLVAGLGFASYPWVSANFLERNVGAWRIYDAVSGPLPAHARLTESDAPLRVIVEMTTTGVLDPADDQAVLTLTATTGGRTVLAEALDFEDAEPRETNPQTQEKVFRDTAGVLDMLEPGAYVFTAGPGDAEGVSVRFVDLVLRTEAAPFDERLQPLGFALMAIGFFGFVLALRRGRPERNPNSQPPGPRWGRGGAPR